MRMLGEAYLYGSSVPADRAQALHGWPGPPRPAT